MNHNFKSSTLTLLYAALWLLVVAFVVLSECSVVPSEYIAYDPSSAYTISIVCIFSALGSMVLSFTMMRSKFVQKDVARCAGEEAQKRRYRAWLVGRMALTFVVALLNAVLYYGAAYDVSAKYCLLIALAACLVAYPSMKDCPEPQSIAQPEHQPDSKPGPQSAAKSEPQSVAQPEPQSDEDLEPQSAEKND